MDSRKVTCKCGAYLGTVNVDTSTEHTTRGTCPHCKKRYTIISGKGKVKVQVEWGDIYSSKRSDLSSTLHAGSGNFRKTWNVE